MHRRHRPPDQRDASASAGACQPPSLPNSADHAQRKSSHRVQLSAQNVAGSTVSRHGDQPPSNSWSLLRLHSTAPTLQFPRSGKIYNSILGKNLRIPRRHNCSDSQVSRSCQPVQQNSSLNEPLVRSSFKLAPSLGRSLSHGTNAWQAAMAIMLTQLCAKHCKHTQHHKRRQT